MSTFRLFLLCLWALALAQGQKLPVRVTLPANNATVPNRPCIAGSIADDTSPVYCIVHPLDVDTYWVQPPIYGNH